MKIYTQFTYTNVYQNIPTYTKIYQRIPTPVFKFLIYRNLSINGNYKKILNQTAPVYVAKLDMMMSVFHTQAQYTVYSIIKLYISHQYRQWPRRLYNRVQQGQGIFCFAKQSDEHWGSSNLLLMGSDIKQHCVKLITHICLVPTVKMLESVVLLLRTSSARRSYLCTRAVCPSVGTPY